MTSGDGEGQADGRCDDAVVVALGSNLGGGQGSSVAVLEAALGRFEGLGLKILKRSAWWRSHAWPDRSQPDYLNGVAIVETRLNAFDALQALHAIEAEFGRVRHERNAARTLDLDLIAHGRQRLDGPGLRLPHPRAAERRFVMGPLAQIAPAWRHPETGETAAALAERATVGVDAEPV
jgi:2-amino-4-hydroxy-6-hydroxymethyldihydropteridine diphosphokinase